jgi:hypothetical protein
MDICLLVVGTAIGIFVIAACLALTAMCVHLVVEISLDTSNNIRKAKRR